MTNAEKRNELEKRRLRINTAIVNACVEILESDVPPADKLKAIEALHKLHLI